MSLRGEGSDRQTQVPIVLLVPVGFQFVLASSHLISAYLPASSADLIVSSGLPHNAEATASLSTYVKSNLYYPYASSFKSSPSLNKP